MLGAFALILSYEFKAQTILSEFNTPQQQEKLKAARSANKEYSFFERAMQEYEDNPSTENRDHVHASFNVFANRINEYKNGAYPSLSASNPAFSKHLPPVSLWIEKTQTTLNELSPTNLEKIKDSADRMSPHLRQVVNALDSRYTQILDAKKTKVMELLKYRTVLNVILLGAMLIFSVITLRTLWRNQQTLLQLKEAEQKAQAANTAKSHFLASISHEMRTPLTTILGYAELTQKMANLPTTEQQYLNHIIQASHHLQTLLGNVLDMSKIEAGHFSLNEVVLDTQSFVNELKAIFSPLAEKKGLRLEIQTSTDLPAALLLDAGKWRQILLNLLSNAIKFSESGAIHCQLSSTVQRTGLIELKATVSDQGLGISPSETPLVFKPFEQTESGLFKGGTGLGLAISKEFAVKMGGDLTFVSQLNVGSTFTATVQAETQTLSANKNAVGSPLSGLVILLVEDQEVNRDLMRQILTDAQASVFEAANGKEALTVLAQNPSINTVLIDRNMPELDGIATIEAMRQQGYFLPTLMVSAGLQPSPAEVQRIGLNGWLGKPFTANGLLEAVAHIALPAESHYHNNPHLSPNDELENSLYFNPEAPNRLGFNPKRFAALSQKGLNRIDEILQQLTNNTDPDECCRLAHSGKGIALQIGADRVAQLLEQIEFAQGEFQAEQLIELSLEMRLTHLAVGEYSQQSQYLPPTI